MGMDTRNSVREYKDSPAATARVADLQIYYGAGL
jgi:hypothetical protein